MWTSTRIPTRRGRRWARRRGRGRVRRLRRRGQRLHMSLGSWCCAGGKHVSPAASAATRPIAARL